MSRVSRSDRSRRLASTAFALIAACGLASCASSGVKVDPSKLSSLHPNQTTYDQTVALLGKPTGTTMNSDGTSSAQYTYVHAEPDAVNFIPVVGIFAGRTNSETNSLTVNFGRDGKMTTYALSQGSSQTGTGLVSGQSQ